MTKGFEQSWIYGQYKAYWQYNFITDEYFNSDEMYEQIIAEFLNYA